MAFVVFNNYVLAYLAIFSLMFMNCYCFNTKLFNVSKLQSNNDWSTGKASWYGDSYGAGSTGGACGYQNAVAYAPFSSLITAAAPSIYNSNKGCGLCYQVKCTSAFCSGNPVTVVVTDSCPGCPSQGVLFDLSGTSFGTMAIPGKSDQLRNVGLQQIQYRSVPCNYPGVSVAFRVDPGSNNYYFAVAIVYVNGLGLTRADLVDSSGMSYMMSVSWGAVYKAEAPSGLKPPFSISLTAVDGKTVFARNVIPYNYSPGQTYTPGLNF